MGARRASNFGKKKKRLEAANLAKYGTWTCEYCKVEVQKEIENSLTFLTIDHILPIAAGGTNAIENLTVCCAGCNREKGHTFDVSNTRWGNYVRDALHSGFISRA